MNRFLVLFLLIAFNMGLVAQKVPNWENPAVFRVNNEKAHATLLPYADVASASTFNPGNSSLYKLLNGFWKFKYLKNPSETPDDFYKPSFPDETWDKIEVPGNWQLQRKYDPRFSAI